MRIAISYDSILENKVTKRELLERAGMYAPEPEIFEGTEYLLELFWKLDKGRQCVMSPSPLSWQDLAAFQNVAGEKLHPLDIDLIMAMDFAAIFAYNQDANKIPDEVRNIPMTDKERLKSMFKGIIASGGTTGGKNG